MYQDRFSAEMEAKGWLSDNDWMQLRIDSFILRFVLTRVLSRVCPDYVPTSGEQAELNDCYFTTYSETEVPGLALVSMQGSLISCLAFDGKRYVTPTTIDVDEIDPKRLIVTHYYGLNQLTYTGARSAAIGLQLRWPYIKIQLCRLANSGRQRLFNRRSLPVRQRLDLLRDVLAVTKGSDVGVKATLIKVLNSSSH
jgi:hypothetical protein